MTSFHKFGKALVFLFCIALLPSSVLSSDNADKEQAAVLAAGRWLALIDQRNYSAGWNEASASLKNESTLRQWEQVIRSDRETEGTVISRKLKRTMYQADQHGMENVEIWYTTSFQNRKSAVERVYTRLEPDGQWRVTGYVITAGGPSLESMLMALLLTAVIIGLWIMEMKSGQPSISSAQTASLPEQDGFSK